MEKELALSTEIEDRFAALETKAAYLEDYVDQLQQVSTAQSKQVDILRSMIQSLANRIEDMEGDVPSRKPPHY